MHKKIIEQRQRRRHRGLYRILSRNYNALPIVSVHKSNKHIYIYVKKSDYSSTLLSFISDKRNIDTAAKLANDAALKMIDNGITRVVFNKNGYKFHGAVKSIYDTIKKVGVEC